MNGSDFCRDCATVTKERFLGGLALWVAFVSVLAIV